MVYIFWLIKKKLFLASRFLNNTTCTISIAFPYLIREDIEMTTTSKFLDGKMIYYLFFESIDKPVSKYYISFPNPVRAEWAH